MSVARIKRVALYARVSTLHGQDVGLQLEELRQVAGQCGWDLVEEYVDEGVSGAKASRPGLDRLLADAQRGRLTSSWCGSWTGSGGRSNTCSACG